MLLLPPRWMIMMYAMPSMAWAPHASRSDTGHGRARASVLRAQLACWSVNLLVSRMSLDVTN